VSAFIYDLFKNSFPQVFFLNLRESLSLFFLIKNNNFIGAALTANHNNESLDKSSRNTKPMANQNKTVVWCQEN